jgi:hypothetical protein
MSKRKILNQIQPPHTTSPPTLHTYVSNKCKPVCFVPYDSSRAYDIALVDGNALLHICRRECEGLTDFPHKMLELLNTWTAKSRKIVVVFDGSPPLAKRASSRTTRGGKRPRADILPPVLPGSAFLLQLEQQLSRDDRIEVQSSSLPYEGEHKIFHALNKLEQARVCVVSQDIDTLLMLTLCRCTGIIIVRPCAQQQYDVDIFKNWVHTQWVSPEDFFVAASLAYGNDFVQAVALPCATDTPANERVNQMEKLRSAIRKWKPKGAFTLVRREAKYVTLDLAAIQTAIRIMGFESPPQGTWKAEKRDGVRGVKWLTSLEYATNYYLRHELVISRCLYAPMQDMEVDYEELCAVTEESITKSIESQTSWRHSTGEVWVATKDVLANENLHQAVMTIAGCSDQDELSTVLEQFRETGCGKMMDSIVEATKGKMSSASWFVSKYKHIMDVAIALTN